MKKRSNLLFYLLLNILVSAATTLIVLWAWDHMRSEGPLSAPLPPAPVVLSQNATQNDVPASPSVTPIVPLETPKPTETLPPPGGDPVISIVSVVGVGDLEQEVVMLKRAGQGNLNLVGWKLEGEHSNTYTFPGQPELILYKDGAVQVYTKTGTDTVTEVYWNRTSAAWRSGEMIRLLDPQGAERASYRIP